MTWLVRKSHGSFNGSLWGVNWNQKHVDDALSGSGHMIHHSFSQFLFIGNEMLVHGVCFKSSHIMTPLKLSREFHDHTLHDM